LSFREYGTPSLLSIRSTVLSGVVRVALTRLIRREVAGSVLYRDFNLGRLELRSGKGSRTVCPGHETV